MTQRSAFRDAFNVSRETMEALDRYESLIRKWNPQINLVSSATLTDIWDRHFFDSAAIIGCVQKPAGRWIDLGSGAGFPGVVVALMARDMGIDARVTCVEADIRKGAFIRTVSAETGAPVDVLTRRIEDVPPQSADIVTARALAPLTRLLAHCERHLAPGGAGVFLKGKSYRQEIEEALETHRFSVDIHASPTNPESAILVVGDVRRA